MVVAVYDRVLEIPANLKGLEKRGLPMLLMIGSLASLGRFAKTLVLPFESFAFVL